jgi:hypothetical protein
MSKLDLPKRDSTNELLFYLHQSIKTEKKEIYWDILKIFFWVALAIPAYLDSNKLYWLDILSLVAVTICLILSLIELSVDCMSFKETKRLIVSIEESQLANEMTKLDLTKSVQTRDGKKAIILSTDRISTKYPIVALIEEEEKLYCYTAQGKFYSNSDAQHDLDLVNVPNEISSELIRATNSSV